MPDLVTALPEIILLTAACVVLLAEVFAAPGRLGPVYALAQAALAATALGVAAGFPGEEVRAFSGMYVADPLAGVLKLVLLGVGAFVFVYAREYFDRRSAARGEMATRKLILFRHESALGNAQAHALFDRVRTWRVHEGSRQPVGSATTDNWPPARQWADYAVTIDHEGLPSGIEIIERC